eukprot:TRINITY_DN3751_c0_g4_i1.p1 TRINITY_DN3751_c0_g4~~TRINITY_DN3751_c0_g4_i1.p1  ORF type:complete len:380 (-),score=119.84 TRINITY_DN3751_c0_g4_i1:255-1334(-)
MGLCGGKEKKDEDVISEEEEEEEEEAEGSGEDDEKEVKLLLLGAGESGKSTIAKQIQIIHLSGFTPEERKGYKEVVHSNILLAMRALYEAAMKFGVTVSPENEACAKEVAEAAAKAEETTHAEVSPELGQRIKKLWTDEGIQQTFKRSNEFQITDNSAYFFRDLDRVSAADYIPNEEDVLRCRAKTTGITETHFQMEGIRFKLVDVGGQRSERKKWIHCFEEVTMVIFCVAMSEYDMKLYEDDKTNRMTESLKLFDEICNSKWFSATPIVLFLNKSDLFRQKIEKIDLNVAFPEYTGGCDFNAAADFIQKKFVSLNRNAAQKQIYPHVTCATDTQNIRVIFKAVKELIIQQAFAQSGLI